MTLNLTFIRTGNRIRLAAAVLRMVRQLARLAAAADRRNYYL